MSDPTVLPVIATMPFEAALQELETIVSRLEKGQVPLTDSINLYERGEELKKHCEKLLEDAEMRISKIMLTPGGVPAGVEPLDGG